MMPPVRRYGALEMLADHFTARPADIPDPYSPRPNLGLGRGGYPWALY